MEPNFNNYEDIQFGLGAFYGDNRPLEANENRLMLESGEREQLFFSGGENSPSSTTGESEGEVDNETSPSSSEEPPVLDCVTRNSAESEIMEAVMDALINEKKILVECPQRLNRKILILKAILKFWQWRKNGVRIDVADNVYDDDRIPTPSRIYIGTRDFRETEEFLAEIKSLGTTQLLWKIRMSVLGHRKNLCTNEEVISNYTYKADINHACKKLTQPFKDNFPSSSKKARQEAHGCDYFCNSYANFDGALPFVMQSDHGTLGLERPPQQVMDIEDVKEHCGGTNRCPYYDVRHLAQQADLVICPVEFLLSAHLRDEYSIELDGAIILIDDGYDLENLCRKEATIHMTLENLNSAASFVRTITEYYQRHQQVEIGLTELSDFLPDLSQWLARTANNADTRPDREDILNIINSFKVYAINLAEVMKVIVEYSENFALSIHNNEASIIEQLKKFITTLTLLCQHNDSFWVNVEHRDSPLPRSTKKVKTLQIICADPSLLFELVGNSAISLIVGSNIIAPYSNFDSEFGTIFEKTVKIQNPTLRNKLLVFYASHGPTGVKYSMDFNTRNDHQVMEEAGISVLEFCRNIPNGKIVLFHSTSYLKKIKDYWQKTSAQENSNVTLLDEIRNTTEFFCELDVLYDESEQIRMMERFKAHATTNKGAVLLALHRGKIYKNWDLKYQGLRGVLHISIPYGPWVNDEFILSKRKYLEIKFNERDCLQNKEWYHREVFRTANQSFCHTAAMQQENGWGIVIFLDSRMHGERHEFRDMLPDWINRPTPPYYYKQFDRLMDEVRNKIQEWNAVEHA